MYPVIGFVVLALVIVALVLLHKLLLPFVVGIALAYLLLPCVAWLEKHGVSRAPAAVLSVLAVLATLIGIVILVTPSLVNQVRSLAQEIPQAWSTLLGASPSLAKYAQQITDQLPNDITPSAHAISMADYQHIAGKLFSTSFAIIARAVLLLLIPIIAIYFIISWPQRTLAVIGLVPMRYKPAAQDLIKEVDCTLRSMLRGILSMSMIMMVTYTVILTLLGIKYGVVIGVVAGLLSFIPFLGSSIGLIGTALVATDQFWPDWLMILLACSTFAAGQIVADHVIAPQVMGGALKLNPLWILFGVLVGGMLFGFLGMLLAFPVMAILRVLIHRILHMYKGSAFYTQPSSS